MYHLGPAFVLPSMLVRFWLFPSPRILSALWQSKTLFSFKDIRPVGTIITPRGRRSRRGSSRFEESRPLGPSSPPPFAFPPPRIEEQELDERLTVFEVTARFQWKRRRVETLKKSKDPNEPTDSKRRFISFRRYKNDIWSKL